MPYTKDRESNDRRDDREVYRPNLQQTGMHRNGRYEYSCRECGMTWAGYGELRPGCPNCDRAR